MNAWGRTTRAELYRMVRWPAVWITVGAWAALALMFGYLFSYLSYRTGDRSFSTEGSTDAQLLAGLLPSGAPDVLLQGMPMFGGALMMVLGALAAGNGYGWGTWKSLFSQGPSRTAAIAGSVTAVLCFVVGVVIGTLVLDLAVSTLIAVSEGQDVAWPGAGDIARAVGVGTLVLGMWAMAGYLLGTVARGPALSVGLGLVWALVIENLLRGVGTILGAIEALTHVLPGTAAGSLVGAVIGLASDTPGVVQAISGPRAVVTVALYLVLFPVVTVFVVRRRDLSG